MSSEVRQVDLESAIKPQPRRLTRGQYAWRLLSFLLALLGLVIAFRNVIPSPEQKSLLAADRAMAAAAEEDDDAAFLSFWTEDGEIIQDNPTRSATIADYAIEHWSTPGFSILRKPKRATVMEDTGVTFGRCKIVRRFASGRSVEEEKDYGSYWERTPDGWKCARFYVLP